MNRLLRVRRATRFVLAILALAWLSPWKAFSVDFRFDHLTIEDGLSHSKVNAIYQDTRGYMWFGTNDGLNRYDGYTIRVYQHSPSDPTSLSHNLIRQILEDRNGNLWIATDSGGLNLYQRDEDNFIHLQHDPKNPASLSSDHLNGLVEGNDGRIWIASREGLNLFDPTTRTAKHYSHDPEDPKSIASDVIQSVLLGSGNRLWVGYDGAGLDCLYLDTGRIVHYNETTAVRLSARSIHALSEDSLGNVWVGSYDSGVFVLRAGSGYFEEVKDGMGNQISTSRVISEDGEGNVWIGSINGLLVYALASGSIRLHDTVSEGPLSLSHSSVLCIFEDENKDFWLGTRGGVNYFNRNKAAFKLFPHVPNNRHYLNSPVVYSMLEDEAGDLWVGTETGGVNRLNRRTGQYTYYLPGTKGSINSANVKAIHKDRSGDFWFGTFRGGLNLMDATSAKFHAYMHDPNDSDSLSDNDVYSIAEDGNGDLWVATHFGVNVMVRAEERFIRHAHDETDPASLSHNDCKVVYIDSESFVWVGTFSGLNKFVPDTNGWERYSNERTDSASLSDSYVQALYEDSIGRFWVGTQGGGLNLMDRSSGKFTAYRKGDGLANNSIYGILEDDAGNLWLSTNGGISKFNPATEKFRNYDVDDGLQSNQFSYNASLRTPSGELFFGGIKGINSFFPGVVNDNDYVPPLVFTDLLLFNESIRVGDEDGILQKHVSETQSISLTHEHSVITFGFAALNYNSSRDNQYAYLLEGFDSEWRDIGTRREVTFTNLDPGDYLLRIKASNNHGVWNDEGVSLAISISPPYWETVWFRLLMAVTILYVGYLTYRFRTRSITRQNAELQQMNLALENAKHEISELNTSLEEKVGKRTSELLAVNRELESFAYSVSHDLRAPLRGINGFCQVLLDDYKDKLDEQGIDYLRRVRNASVRMGNLIDSLLNMSRIVRREMIHLHVNVSQLATTIADELQLADKERVAHFEIQPGIHVKGDPNLIRIVLENILRNAWKYSGERSETRIEIGLDPTREHTLFVRDNGVGFDMKYVKMLFEPFQRLHSEKRFKGSGIGLATVKRIINRHQGDVWAEGRVDEGSTFYISISTLVVIG